MKNTRKEERKPRERIILSLEDWQHIIGRFKDTRFYILLMTGFYTGLRISEAFALTWDDIDFDKRTLTVNKQVIKRIPGTDAREEAGQKDSSVKHHSWYFTTPKTASSVRTIPFGTTLYNALKAELATQVKNEIKYGESYTIHVLKKETDEKGNKIYRIVPVQKCIGSQLERTRLVCIDKNGQYTSTDSFKYCTEVIHHELHLAFDYHSLRHPYVKPTTKNISL